MTCFFIAILVSEINDSRQAMAKGTRDFKRLENMLKENEQKRDKELNEIDQRRERDIARIDATIEEIKTFINGITFHYNDIRSQLQNRDQGNYVHWIFHTKVITSILSMPPSWDERPY